MIIILKLCYRSIVMWKAVSSIYLGSTSWLIGTYRLCGDSNDKEWIYFGVKSMVCLLSLAGLLSG